MKSKLYLLIATVGLITGIFVFSKPGIERMDGETGPVYDCPGCGTNHAVTYADRRNKDKGTQYYYDSGQNGTLDVYQQNEFHRTGGEPSSSLFFWGYFDARVEFKNTEQEAEQWNEAAKKEASWRGGVRYVWRESAEADKLQKEYNDLRAKYRERYPDYASKLKENTPQPELPVDQAKIGLFRKMLAEYQHQSQVSGSLKDEAQEIAGYKAFLVFPEVRKAYNRLNVSEQKHLFVAGGEELRQIADIPPHNANPRRAFEDWLRSSHYMEIDGVSRTSIFQDSEAKAKKIRTAYNEELQQKGLKVP